MIRILIIGALLRIILRNDCHRFEWEKNDTLIISYIFVLSISYILLRQTNSAIFNRMGFAFETLFTFFIIRTYIHSILQIIIFIRSLAFVCFLLAIFMYIEHITQRNLFAIFGGVHEITPMREGRLRAQGAFSHPIMAGTFGAAFLPLFWGLRAIGTEKDKKIAILGIISSLFITWASSSSGPVITLLSSILAIFIWNFRIYLKLFHTIIILLLVGLHIIMEAPVWHLISRIDIVGGSTGWHRYYLIDQTILRFREWAFVGIRSTGHWGWGLNDVTNMFVKQAIDGGILALLFFVLLIFFCFRSVKKAIKNNATDTEQNKFYWAWGAVLFSHCVSFLGVSYFGQMNFFFFFTLGIITCLPTIDTEYEKNQSLS